jgi:hypothetical protein
MKHYSHVAAAAVALACSACGNPHGIYPVSGKVTYKGGPAAGAFVFLVRQGADSVRDQTMMGVVQGDGSFTVDCGDFGKGAPPGEYDVLVQWRYDPSLPAARSPTEAAARGDRLKGRYADRKRPLLHTVVRPESNVLSPFELTD